MNKITFSNIKKAHFIGIGGISMSGLAQILHSKGVKVTGSDISETDLTLLLRELGIDINIGHSSENLPPDCGLVIHTAAVKPDNPEVLAANELKIPFIDRAELLGLIMGAYERSIGVSGTHGKTTTTSLISEILLLAGYDPTLNVGGIFKGIGSNFRIGGSGYFVAEACEYFDSFSKFYPFIGVILNIEHDHTDYFKNTNQLRGSFHRFAENVSESGLLVVNSDIHDLDEFIEGLSCKVITYGEKGDYTAVNIKFSTEGTSSFDIYYKGDCVAEGVKLNLPGKHNVENALAAFAVAYYLGVSSKDIGKAMGQFSGAKRRFETKGEWNGVKIIDDYAHHPTEIAATLAAAKKCEHKKMYAAFQPHTFSRTKAFMDKFADSFCDADVVLLLDIYSARESDDGSVHSRDLAEKITALGIEAYYFESFEAAGCFLKGRCSEGDMIITMGAGDIYKLGEGILWQK
ncbi:MAG: UDP-N-acetylmuramate--L-alanine ligase [Defluviitaleaceae bacterium]|nr:UDP-N-acetylmuramate--L-alanine ligase [Defluviitaleaceae bacterium]